jgi:hypothetical protein
MSSGPITSLFQLYALSSKYTCTNQVSSTYYSYDDEYYPSFNISCCTEEHLCDTATITLSPSTVDSISSMMNINSTLCKDTVTKSSTGKTVTNSCVSCAGLFSFDCSGSECVPQIAGSCSNGDNYTTTMDTKTVTTSSGDSFNIYYYTLETTTCNANGVCQTTLSTPATTNPVATVGFKAYHYNPPPVAEGDTSIEEG